MWIILGLMQISVDNRVIDRRIAELCQDWMHDNGRNAVQVDLQPSLNAVFDEGLKANAGGKRLRALLALAAFHAYRADDPSENRQDPDCRAKVQEHAAGPFGVNDGETVDAIPQAMLDLACAIEIYQTSALIHDDIIDDSPRRRGRASAHVALSRKNAPDNFGTGLALMLGNMLATASADIALKALECPELQHSEINLHTFFQMQRAVEIGQTLDLGAETISLERSNELIAASLNVFAWKTASYTTIAPLELGLCAAGMPPQTAHRTAHDIGLPLGVAFQLADDLLDVIGTSKSTGKPVGGDIREGKHTVLLADALQSVDETNRNTLIRIYRQSTRSDAEVQNVLGLFASSGAVDISRKRIRDLWQQTQCAIGKIDISSKGQAALTDCCARFIDDELR